MIVRLFLVGAYALLLISISAVMFWARGASARGFGTPQADAAWQTWRGEVQQRQPDRGGVARDVPRSAEPPALVLLRDHFFSCLAMAVIISSALYWTLAFMIAGVISNRWRPRVAE